LMASEAGQQESADLPFVRQVDISFNYIRYFQSLNYGALFSTFSLKKIGTFGLGVVTLVYDEIIRTELTASEDYVTKGTINLVDYAFLLNYGIMLDRHIRLGINLKAAFRSPHDAQLNYFLYDAGFIYQEEEWGIGLSVKEIAPVLFSRELQYDLPVDLHLGGHYLVREKKLLISPLDRIMITAELRKKLYHEMIFSTGLEYTWRNFISVRAGCQINGNDDGLKAGAGVRYKTYELNYAFNSYTDLGYVHYFGLNIGIGPGSRAAAHEGLRARTNILVLQFDNLTKNNELDFLEKTIREEIRFCIQKSSNGYNMAEDIRVSVPVGSGNPDEKVSKELLNRHKVKYFITGNIVEIENKVKINIYVYDLAHNSLARADSYTGEVNQGFLADFDQFLALNIIPLFKKD
ncbi:MAG: hypothetical protein PHF84_06435, partial [bacterium]|nr:hypothetical protein [bacterium]